MNTQDLIDSLAADLAPVRPIRPKSGIALVLVALAAAVLVVIAAFGARADVAAGRPDAIVVVRCLLLALLGLATTIAVTHAARPAVGRAGDGWLWALAAAAVMPVAALLLYGWHRMTGMPFAADDMDFHYAPWCLGISAAAGLVIGAAQTAWLRRGAPCDPERAGWLVGLAAGSFGTFAYSLHCPSNSIYYIGLFYTAAVALCAAVARLVVPALVRW